MLVSFVQWCLQTSSRHYILAWEREEFSKEPDIRVWVSDTQKQLSPGETAKGKIPLGEGFNTL